MSNDTLVMAFGDHPVVEGVRRALGRGGGPRRGEGEKPVAPVLAEHVIRLVHSEFGLVELFVARARANGMVVHQVSADDLARRVVGRAGELGLRRIVRSEGAIFEKLGVTAALSAAGVEVVAWGGEGCLEAAYEMDAGLTDVWAGVAETGSLVLRAGPGSGRAVSLVPGVHLVVLEPKLLVPDLVDLFEMMGRENGDSGVVIVSGPSKTADIEMSPVTGVHGPGVVEVFVLR